MEKVQKIQVQTIDGKRTAIYVLEPITIKVKFSFWERVSMLWKKLKNSRIHIRLDARLQYGDKLSFIGVFGNLVSVDLF